VCTFIHPTCKTIVIRAARSRGAGRRRNRYAADRTRMFRAGEANRIESYFRETNLPKIACWQGQSQAAGRNVGTHLSYAMERRRTHLHADVPLILPFSAGGRRAFSCSVAIDPHPRKVPHVRLNQGGGKILDAANKHAAGSFPELPNLGAAKRGLTTTRRAIIGVRS
jgi:hypothetical protein